MPRRLDLFPDILGKDWWEATNYQRQLLKQKFATVLSDKDFSENDAYEYKGFKVRPRMPASTKASGTAEVKINEGGFQITLDLDKEFQLKDLEVNRIDRYIEIKGKQEEKEDEHGLVSREFCRQYMVPHNCDIDATEIAFSDYGKLKIKVPKGSNTVTVPNTELVLVEDANTGKKHMPSKERLVNELDNAVKFLKKKPMMPDKQSTTTNVTSNVAESVRSVIDVEDGLLQEEKRHCESNGDSGKKPRKETNEPLEMLTLEKIIPIQIH